MRNNKLLPLLLAFFISFPTSAPAPAYETPPQSPPHLLAGAHAQNIDPLAFPVWVSGGIAAIRSDRVVDSLFARALVLEQSPSQAIALCVVDSLGIPADIVKQAKQIVSEKTPLRPEQILISATHTHSAPAAMGAHGTPAQSDYALQLPNRIAQAIINAYNKRTPAQVGYAVAHADRFVYCRRWIMEPGQAPGVLFSGRDSNIVAMNPGHDSPFKIRQTSEVDPTIPILAIRSADGSPLALLASFSTHYAGAPAISSDYFGVVVKELARELRPDSPDSFVAIMANGTSGDTNCIDFSRPAKPFNYHEVGKYVASKILDALPNAKYDSAPTLNAAFETIEADVRLADRDELAAAKAYVQSKLADRLPTTLEENYARETVLLSEMPPTRNLPLQALRVGDMVIAAYPTETFTATGLAVRRNSPAPFTLNIGLANDLAGYLPPADQFPLGGYTTWRARTSCLAPDTEARVVEQLSSLIQKLYTPTPPATHTIEQVQHAGPDTVISPKESLKHFEIQYGNKIELVASEPNCIDPVAIRFDDAGDLWVVEMCDYPTRRPEIPAGRIKKLRDEDLDGFFESVTLFADELPYPTGLQLHRDGLLVTSGASLWFLRDTNGDGLADERTEWLGGFAQENQQLRANDPDFGIDGKLYVANGLRSSQVTDKSIAEPNQTTTNLANSDLQWDWIRKQGRGVAGPSQFGMAFDRFGNRYFCSNRNPCDAVLIEPWLAAKSPLVGLAPMTAPVLPPGERSTVYPLVSAWTTSNLHAGQFTAACGLLVSHSHHLPAASLGHALTCEPTGSLVHRVALGRAQGKSIPEEPSRDSEWLASTDPWFRPVNLEEGPEGGIYIVDMHRAVIEHPDWVPDELKVRPDERWGDRAGRIYRVVDDKTSNLDPIFLDPIFKELRNNPLRKRSSSELIDLLNHPQQWIRSTSSRLLYERLASNAESATDNARAELSTIAAELNSYIQSATTRRVHAQGLLHATAILNEADALLGNNQNISTLITLLREENGLTSPSSRAHLWKCLADRLIQTPTNQSASTQNEPAPISLTTSQLEDLTNLAIDALENSSREEALAAASLLTLLPAPPADSQASGKLLTSSIQRALDVADDPYALMILSAIHQQHRTLEPFVCNCLTEASKRLDNKQLTRNFSTTAWSRLVAAIAQPSNSAWQTTKAIWIADAQARLANYPKHSSEGTQTHDEIKRRVIDEPQLLLHAAIAQGIANSPDKTWLADQTELWQAIADQLANPLWPKQLRKDWIALTGMHLTPDQSRLCAASLRNIFPSSSNNVLDPDTKLAALAAWAKHPDPQLTDWMLERYDTETPAMRSAMFQVFRNSPEKLNRWLDAMDAGTLSNNRIDANQIQALKQVQGEAAPRIEKLLAGRIQSDRQTLVENVMKELTAQGLINPPPNTNTPTNTVVHSSSSAKTNRENGKQLFAQHCAACHRIDNVGVNLGPDISDSRTQSPAQLLVSILDPNRAIDNQYFRVSVRMLDGTVYDGIIREESSQHILLNTQQQPNVSLPKSQIETLVSSGKSLMPEGFEAQLNNAALADLIDYIKNWRYAP